MDLGSLVISSTLIESLIVLFQCTNNGKYNAFYHGRHPTRCDTCTVRHAHRPDVPRECSASVGDDVPFGGISAPKGSKAQLMPYCIKWITESVFSANRYWADSSYLGTVRRHSYFTLERPIS